MSPSASKESDTEAESTQEEEIKDQTRGEIEVLILVAGLIMTPLFYYWQTAIANIANISGPIWQNYLQTQLGHPSPYSFNEIVAAYFSPFGLLVILPIDIILWIYDGMVVLSIISLMIFGFALLKIETGDAKLVSALTQKGRLSLNVVLLLLIGFAAFHVLNNSMFPFKVPLGPLWVWTFLGISLLTGIVGFRLLNRYMEKAITPSSSPQHRKKSENPQVDSVSTEP